MEWNVRTRKIAARSVGYICIGIFFVLTTYIVYVYYTTIIPSALKKKKYKNFLFHITFGNWVAINIYFNFIMAWLSSPGLSKYCQDLTARYPLCKKCSMKKPPRTHHCRWCDLCILEFDHHCPWLNNCIGFYNHRYFFQFCCFMASGCFYAGTLGYREYQIGRLGEQVFYYEDTLFKPFDILYTMRVVGFITYHIFIAALVISFMLICLIWRQARMISRGETSVEHLCHQHYAQQCTDRGYIFVNPFDFGLLKNWKQFFNVRTLGEFIRRILLPSTHKPKGDGTIWSAYNVNITLQSHQSDPKSSTRPIAFPPSGHLNFYANYPINLYRSVIMLPWEDQSTETIYSSKDR